MKTPLLLTLLLAAQLAHAENSDTAQCDRVADPMHPGNPAGAPGTETPPRFEDDSTTWDALRLACENSYAAHPDTPRYAYQLARLYSARDYNVSAEKYLKTAAEQGDPVAQSEYGKILNDQGFDGTDWQKKAAAQGIVPAMEALGDYYDADENPAAARQWYEKAATAGNARAAWKLGDLFHRLNVIRLRLPPLAERVEDIPLLAEHFLAESAASLGVEPKQLGADALRVLCAFDWPGNVRQLENVCQWLTVMTAAHVVTMADLPPEMLPSRGAAATVRPVTEAASVAAPQASGTPAVPTGAPDQADIDRETTGPEGWRLLLAKLARQQLEDPQARDLLTPLQASFERTLIEAALEATGGHRGEAARRLGLGRNTLARKIRDLGID